MKKVKNILFLLLVLSFLPLNNINYADELESESVVSENSITGDRNEIDVENDVDNQNDENMANEANETTNSSSVNSDLESDINDGQNINQSDSTSNDSASDASNDDSLNNLEVETKTSTNINKDAHVQGIGWINQTTENIIGCVGQGARLEAFRLSLDNSEAGNIIYESHVEGIGWQGPRTNGEVAGTEGQQKRIEAITIALSGNIANEYDIYYRAHLANYGWCDWTKNGDMAGSIGLSTALEAIEVQLVPKNTDPGLNTKLPLITSINIDKNAHVEGIGWFNQNNSEILGTVGQGQRLEAFQLSLGNNPIGYINYEAHVEGIGWQGVRTSGEIAGTQGQNKRIEAVTLSLGGDATNIYDIYYRTHVSNFGWLGWAKNGEQAGSVGLEAPIEAIEIRVVLKNSPVNFDMNNSLLTQISLKKIAQIEGIGWTNQTDSDILGTVGQGKRLEAFSLNQNQVANSTISYNAHIEGLGWQGTKDGNIVGTEGQGLRIEAVSIGLHGNISKYYDIYYRAHIQGYGWLGWAKNGDVAGSVGIGYRLEGLEIKIEPKTSSKIYPVGDSVKTQPIVIFHQDVPTYFSQRDSRWANISYNGTIGNTGCVPTSIAMVLNGLGINVNPNDVAWYLYNYTGEFNKIEAGASGLAFKLAVEHWGVSARGIDSYEQLCAELSNGKMVLAMVDSRSPFISRGTHAIVLFQSSNGATYVYDPWDAGKNGWYSIGDLWYNWRSTYGYDLRGGHDFVAVG